MFVHQMLYVMSRSGPKFHNMSRTYLAEYSVEKNKKETNTAKTQLKSFFKLPGPKLFQS